MSDTRSIGVFDSGVGGLTVLAAIRRRLPQESTVYLGDTARVPYGTRSAETVVRYALNNARTLLEEAELKLLVVACNTASAVALPALTEALPIPVVGVIDPGAEAALEASRGGTVLVIGTAGTVRSGAYPAALSRAGHRGRVESRACPLFVPLVEEGWTEGPVPSEVAARYLADPPDDLDAVILGCTHYPLLRPVIEATVGDKVHVVDGAEATAREVEQLLTHHGIRNLVGGGVHRFLVTDAPEQMVALAPRFLGYPVDQESVSLVDVNMQPSAPKA